MGEDEKTEREERRKYTNTEFSLTSNKHLNTCLSLELQLFLSKRTLVFSTGQCCVTVVCVEHQGIAAGDLKGRSSVHSSRLRTMSLQWEGE